MPSRLVSYLYFVIGSQSVVDVLTFGFKLVIRVLKIRERTYILCNPETEATVTK